MSIPEGVVSPEYQLPSIEHSYQGSVEKVALIQCNIVRLQMVGEKKSIRMFPNNQKNRIQVINIGIRHLIKTGSLTDHQIKVDPDSTLDKRTGSDLRIFNSNFSLTIKW